MKIKKFFKTVFPVSGLMLAGIIKIFVNITDLIGWLFILLSIICGITLIKKR